MINKWENKFSENIKDYGGYSIGKLFKLLDDPEIISLAGGLPSPDIFLKDEMRVVSHNRLEAEIETIMQYTSIPGEPSLIKAIIHFMKREDISISEENILITSSGQHGLDITGRLFLDQGDIVLLDRPTFAGAIVAFQLQKPTFVGIEIEDDGPNVTLYKEKIKELGNKNKKLKFIYIVPDFQNPSGITMSFEKRQAILDLSYEYDIPIIEDSPYRDLRYYGESIPSIFSIDQKRKGNNVIGLYTFSKLFCPGVRVGYNIGPPEVINKMTNIKEGNLLNTPKYNQDLCTAFLTEIDFNKHIEKCRKYYREKLRIFLNTMEKFFPKDLGVTWTKPEGGLFLWVTLPENIDTKELFYEAIKFKVAFVPGEVFYGENPAKNHMRINFSYASKEELVEAVKRLSECVKNQI